MSSGGGKNVIRPTSSTDVFNQSTQDRKKNWESLKSEVMKREKD